MHFQAMETRVKHSYRTALYAFVKDVLVVCPQCEGKAIVKTGNFQQLDYDVAGVRVICTACGFNKQMDKTSIRSRHLVFGSPIDPFFHLPLWLKTDFSGKILWAYNKEHLTFLMQHVGAKLRERNGFKYQVRSIGARLPRWMTEKNNREAVYKTLEKLMTS